MKKVCIIIPAYNEAGSILNVISAIKKIGHGFKLIIINDGSTDQTRTIVEKQGLPVIN